MSYESVIEQVKTLRLTEYEIVVSEQAEQDLANIYSYILNVLKSELNAEAVLNRLYLAMSELSYMAETYHLYPKDNMSSFKQLLDDENIENKYICLPYTVVVIKSFEDSVRK